MPAFAGPEPPRRSFASLRTAWELKTTGVPRGLALARETGLTLARDDQGYLLLLNRAGERQAQVRWPAPLVAVACSEDGELLACGDRAGELAILAPDLTPRWKTPLPQKIISLACDTQGRYLAVADGAGTLRLFSRHGRSIWSATTPRPLHYLAFIPEAPFLFCAADLGLVCLVEARGRVLWRDGLVANVGSLTVNGNGERCLLSCFSDGFYRYGIESSRPVRLPVESPCRLAASSYDGSLIVATGLTPRLELLDSQARPLSETPLESPATALAVGPLADHAVLGLSSGKLIGLRW